MPDSDSKEKQKLAEFQAALDTMLKKNLNFNPAATNYVLDAGALSHGLFDIFSGNVTNWPNTLVVDAHGEPENYNYSIDPRSRVREGPEFSNFEKASSALQLSNPEFLLSDVATALGPATNDIQHLLNASCYGGSCKTFEQAKSLFPNLKDMVASAPGEKFFPIDIQLLKGDKDSRWLRPAIDTVPLQDISATSTNAVTGPLPWMYPEFPWLQSQMEPYHEGETK